MESSNNNQVAQSESDSEISVLSESYKNKMSKSNNATKTCSKCKIDKTCDMFRGGRKQCKQCDAEYRKKHDIEKQEKIKKGEIVLPDQSTNPSKICKVCGITKEAIMFRTTYNTCKDCMNAQRRLQRSGGKEKQLITEGKKLCKYCKKEKVESMFRHNRAKCIDCERKDGRQYRQSDVGKEKSKKWLESNSEKMTELQANWYQKNKKKINEKYVQRYNSDEGFKMHRLYQVNLNDAIHGPMTDITPIGFLGCSYAFLSEWLQFCFKPEMSLENYGTYWSVDHVIPVDTFDLTKKEEQDSCFNWLNICPLEKKLNNSKHADIDKTQIAEHLKKLEDFTNIQGHKKLKKEVNYVKYCGLCATYLDAENSLEP